MFKNRIRTAALAGAIAVATGVSGMAVPAFAVETNTQQDGFNFEDGSAQTPAVPENILESSLRDQTDATADYLNGFQSATGLSDIVETYLMATTTDGFDHSEEAAEAAFQQAREQATAELATASQNIQNARNSVAYALEVDQTADADWNSLVGELNAAGAALNPLINAVNTAKSISEAPFTDLPNLSTNLQSGDDIVAAYRELLELQDLVDEQYETAGDWNIDQADERYINRDHMNALQALKDALDPQVENVREAYETAVASNIESQKSDVLVRQLYLERAKAQLNTLRVVQATFAVAERYLELYQDDVLHNDTPLSTEYREVLGNLYNGLEDNLTWLASADDAAEEGYLRWESDLGNPAEGEQYIAEKIRFATENYAKVLHNGAVWQESLKRVELIDQGIIDQIKADEAQAEAEKKAAEEAAKADQDRTDALKKIADALAEQNNGNGGNEPAPGNEGSSENAGLIGIIAAIGGVIALIAAAFPFIQNFIR